MNHNPSAIDRMAAQAVPTAEQLHGADAAPDQELARILHQPRLRIAQTRSVQARSVQRRSWRPLLVVAAVLAVLGVLVVVVPALSGSGAAPTAVAPATEPPLPADDEPLTYRTVGVETDPAVVLRGLADRAAAQPPPGGNGPVAYVRTRSGQVVAGAPESYQAESWAAPDGAGHTLLTRDGAPPEVVNEREATRNYLPPTLSTDPAALERAVRGVYELPAEISGFPATLWFGELERRWSLLVVDPQIQATYLRVLATQDGITVAGEVTDRAGRRGVAVTAENTLGLGELTLIFDPDTGALLGTETGPPDHTPGTPPPPPTYTVWLKSAQVPAIGDRP
jgi:hypothetical protein